jgi:hypothetical protein
MEFYSNFLNQVVSTIIGTVGNWILLFILSLLIGGVLYNVWSLVKALEVSLPGT